MHAEDARAGGDGLGAEERRGAVAVAARLRILRGEGGPDLIRKGGEILAGHEHTEGFERSAGFQDRLPYGKNAAEKNR